MVYPILHSVFSVRGLFIRKFAYRLHNRCSSGYKEPCTANRYSWRLPHVTDLYKYAISQHFRSLQLRFMSWIHNNAHSSAVPPIICKSGKIRLAGCVSLCSHAAERHMKRDRLCFGLDHESSHSFMQGSFHKSPLSSHFCAELFPVAMVLDEHDLGLSIKWRWHTLSIPAVVAVDLFAAGTRCVSPCGYIQNAHAYPKSHYYTYKRPDTNSPPCNLYTHANIARSSVIIYRSSARHPAIKTPGERSPVLPATMMRLWRPKDSSWSKATGPHSRLPSG